LNSVCQLDRITDITVPKPLVINGGLLINVEEQIGLVRCSTHLAVLAGDAQALLRALWQVVDERTTKLSGGRSSIASRCEPTAYPYDNQQGWITQREIQRGNRTCNYQGYHCQAFKWCSDSQTTDKT
jgi:hypothetical protein